MCKFKGKKIKKNNENMLLKTMQVHTIFKFEIILTLDYN